LYLICITTNFFIIFREQSGASLNPSGSRLQKDAMQRAKAKIASRTGLTDSEHESDGNKGSYSSLSFIIRLIYNHRLSAMD
jgi:hypothetical protein